MSNSRYIRSLAFLLLFTACGEDEDLCEHVDITSSGIDFCLVGDDVAVDPYMVDRIVGVLESEVNALHPDIYDLPGLFKDVNVQVHLEMTAFAVGCEDLRGGVSRCSTGASGVTLHDGRSIYLRYFPCMSQGALAHELLHVIQFQILGGLPSEGDHTTPGFFGRDSIESRVRDAFTCPQLN